MKNPLFYLETVQTSINLLTLSHIFRNGDNWTVVTASGSTYNISESDYLKLRDAYSDIGKHREERDENSKSIAERLAEIKNLLDKKD